MKKERFVAAPHTFMLSVLLMISIPAAYAIMLISHQESIGAFLRVPGALQVTSRCGYLSCAAGDAFLYALPVGRCY